LRAVAFSAGGNGGRRAPELLAQTKLGLLFCLGSLIAKCLPSPAAFKVETSHALQLNTDLTPP